MKHLATSQPRSQTQSNRIKSSQSQNRIKSNQTESNQIKPNQTESNLRDGGEIGLAGGEKVRGRQPGQTKSNHGVLEIMIKISVQDKNVAHWGNKPEIRKLLEINGPFPRFAERIRSSHPKVGPISARSNQ